MLMLLSQGRGPPGVLAADHYSYGEVQDVPVGQQACGGMRNS